MRHAISYGARTYNWPSIQHASALLFWRIYDAQVCPEEPCDPPLTDGSVDSAKESDAAVAPASASFGQFLFGAAA